MWKNRTSYEMADYYFDLQSFACFKPMKITTKGKLVSLSVGQLVASERFLSERWGCSRSKVRNILNSLKKDHKIDQKKDHGINVLTLCNYWGERQPKQKKEPVKEPEKGHRETSDHTKEEEGEEGKEGTLKKKEFFQPPKLDQALKLIGSTPIPMSEECVQSWFYDRESIGWIKTKGNTQIEIVNWQADLKAYSTTWNLNHSNHSNQSNNSKPQQPAEEEYQPPVFQ